MPTNMNTLVQNIYASGSVMLMTPKSTLIRSAVGLNYSFNLKQMNTGQRHIEKQIYFTKTRQPNTPYENEKSKQINM
jgi:hypothetical protein